ncbi:MAG: serine/threonine protein kinase [Myxococcales bacterium]|nr:serine/threonine protein kinase [Myxococcales bacterium]
MSNSGKYRLIAELGQGGMANVFLAVTQGASGLDFSKLVVLKKLREHLATDPDFVSMFMDEARLAARLNHPNVVQTYEVDRSDDELYLAMEYLDGQPLHRVLHRARDKFTLPMHLLVLTDVLAGIHHAHELLDYDGSPLNVVHRDVTPHNIFVTYDGQVKVVDFGIAKAEGRGSETKHGVIKGKVAYMSPEQARGEVVDRRADVFAVGVMLYEACVGERMWKGLTDSEIVRSIYRSKHPVSPRAKNPAVAPELDAIVQKALAGLPDARYASAAALQADLEAYIDDHLQRPSHRQLGKFVSELFEDRRALSRQVIESQLADLKAAKSGTKVVAIPDENLPTTIPVPSTSAAAASSTAPVVASSAAPSDARGSTPKGPAPVEFEISGADLLGKKSPPEEPRSGAPARPRSSRAVGYAAVAAGALAVIGAAAFAATREAPKAAAPPELPSSAPSITASPPAEVTVTIRATPNETQFTIDDGPVLENPYSAKVPKDGKDHKVKALARGYETKSQVARFDGDVSIRFALGRVEDAGKKGGH